MGLEEATQKVRGLVDNVEKVIRGKRREVELAVLSLICGGHALIEDVPGVGKTMLARSLAKSISGSFSRIQFTPDLLPTDITGVNIFNQQTRQFEFIRGAVFANVILADEINRTSPRTQSSLLEAMEEGQVTVEGKTHLLPKPFFVIATQNPYELHGTYPLPEGQLDRFFISYSLGYPSEDEEKAVVLSQMITHPIEELLPVITAEEISEIQRVVKETYVHPDVLTYIYDIIERTRTHPEVVIGGSPRGTIMLTRAAQGRAVFSGRDFITPDDVKFAASYVLTHRLVFSPQIRAKKGAGRAVLEEMVSSVEVRVALRA